MSLSLLPRLACLAGLLCLCPATLRAQPRSQGASLDSLSLQSKALEFEEQLAQQVQLGLITDEEADLLRERYEALRLSPLDINTASEQDLQRLPFVSDYQIYQLLSYRADHRTFHLVSELKLVSGWTPELLRLLRPLLRCGETEARLSWQEANLRARSSWLLYYGRRSAPPTSRSPWLGPPDAGRIQWTHELPQHLRLFFAGEKDYGEPWRGSRGIRPDSYNLSAELSFAHGRLLLGDYRLARGCGLVLGQGIFPLTFQSLTPRLSEGARLLSHSTEVGFSRGAVGELHGKGWEVGAFYSSQAVDAHRSPEGELRGIISTGLHRTQQELDRQGQGHTRYYGAWLTLRPQASLQLSFQLLRQDWRGDHLRTPPGSHRQASLRDLASYTAGSLSYRWQSPSGKLRLLGELASTDRRAWAVTQHISLLQQTWGDLHLALWDVGQGYWTAHGRAGTHSLQPNDERGLRLQYQFSPAKLLGTTLLFGERYRSRSTSPSGEALRQGWACGVLSSLPLKGEDRLTLAYHLRRSDHTERTHRFRLQYALEHRGWGTRLTLLYSKPAEGRGWAILGNSTGELSRGLQLKALLGYFHAPSWSSRLYTVFPLLAGEYASQLLYGQGAVLGARLQYQPSYRWRVALRIAHVHQRQAMPSTSWVALSLAYRS